MTRARDSGSIFAADGSLNINTSVNLGDNEKAYFGTSNDLQIYHDASASYIDETGTGSLYIRSNGTQVFITDSTSSNHVARFTPGGEATLYNAGNIKLQTTGTGIDVTGTVTADGAVIEGASAGVNYKANSRAFFGSLYSSHFAVLGSAVKADETANAQMVATETSTGNGLPSAIQLGAGNIDFHTIASSTTNAAFDNKRMRIDKNGDIAFYDSTGTTQGFFWDASTQNLGVGVTNPATTLHVKGGTNENVMIVDATGTAANYIFDVRDDGTSVFRVDPSGNVGIGTNSPNNTLEIKSTTNADGIRLSNNVGSYYHLVRSNGDGLLFDADAGNTGGSGADIRFQVKGSEKVRIKSNGVVAQKGDNGWESKILFSGDGSSPYIQVKTNIRRTTNVMYYAHIIGHKSYDGSRVNTILTGYAYAAYIGTQSSQYHGYSNLGTYGIQDVYYSSDDYMCFTIDSGYSAYSMTLGTNMSGYSLSTQPDILSYTNQSSTTRYY